VRVQGATTPLRFGNHHFESVAGQHANRGCVHGTKQLGHHATDEQRDAAAPFSKRGCERRQWSAFMRGWHDGSQRVDFATRLRQHRGYEPIDTETLDGAQERKHDRQRSGVRDQCAQRPTLKTDPPARSQSRAIDFRSREFEHRPKLYA